MLAKERTLPYGPAGCIYSHVRQSKHLGVFATASGHPSTDAWPKWWQGGSITWEHLQCHFCLLLNRWMVKSRVRMGHALVNVYANATTSGHSPAIGQPEAALRLPNHEPQIVCHHHGEYSHLRGTLMLLAWPWRNHAITPWAKLAWPFSVVHGDIWIGPYAEVCQLCFKPHHPNIWLTLFPILSI